MGSHCMRGPNRPTQREPEIIDFDYCVAATNEKIVEEMKSLSVALTDQGYRGAPREGQDGLESEYTIGI